MEDFVFQPAMQQYCVKSIGTFVLRPLCLLHDIPEIHTWVTQPYAKFWGMQNFTLEQVTEEYQKLCQNTWVFIGECDGRPTFLTEIYSPAKDAIGRHYDVQLGDWGMHLLVAPSDQPISGFTWAVFKTVMNFIFSDPQVQRIVVEPDNNNSKIHALNARAGFVFSHTVVLPYKHARLEFCTRTHFLHNLKKEKTLC